MNDMKYIRFFDQSELREPKTKRRIRWDLQTERDALSNSMNHYARVLANEDKLTPDQWFQLTRERNLMSVRLDQVKRLLIDAGRSEYDKSRFTNSVAVPYKVPQGVKLWR